MARKRSTGGGRKPQGPFKGKTATLTTRITPATRMSLEREAKRREQSLSQEIERRLEESLRSDRDTPSHIQALAKAVTLLAMQIEQVTGMRWIDDPFAGDALRHGIEALIFHFAPTPDGTAAIPPQVEAASARMQPKLREAYRSPELLGQMEAGTVITLIENAPEASANVKPPAGHIIDPRGFVQILSGVGSGWQRNRKVWNKETKR
jgi:hypothetical protein